MTLDWTRLPILVLALSAAAAPAAAQFRRTGLLSWSFDDMTVNSGAGRVHASKWGQAYSLDVDGPLVTPDWGTMRSGFSHSRGANIAQAANTSVPEQQLTNFSVGADLFNTALRRFVRFTPNFSRSYLHQQGLANGVGYSNTVAQNTWGLSTGLSLPRMPAIGYSRQVSDMRNPNDVSPVKVRSATESKSVSYFLGHTVLNASEQTDRIEDLLGLTARQETDYRQASLETNYYDPKWSKRLQSLFLRTDVSQIANNGTIAQKVGSASFSLFTRPFQAGRWESALNYGAGGTRDFQRAADTFSHTASLNSTRPVPTGTLTSAFSTFHAPTAATESLNEGLSLSQSFRRNALSTNLGVNGGLNRTLAGSSLSDGASGRANLFPGGPRSFFAEARTSETQSARGRTGSRVNHYALGADDRSRRLLTTVRVERDDSHYYAGSRSLSDRFTVDTSGRVVPKLLVSAGYNLGVVYYDSGDRRVNQNVHGSLDFSPLRGLELTASMTYSDTGYIASTSASYSVGKTFLKVAFDKREVQSTA